MQQQVHADIGGVLFTSGDRVIVEYAPGGPGDVVSGSRVPTRYAGTGAGAAAQLEPVIRLGRELAAEAAHDVDIEWAVEGDQPWLLQVRPVTAGVDPSVFGADQPVRARPDAGAVADVVAGVGASPGSATGRVRVVHGPDDFGQVRPGEVLVCRTTDPGWTPLLGVVVAVVTEVGGILSHAAIVARERGVPAVVGVRHARQRLHSGQRVTVDGTTGTVMPVV